MSGGISSSRDHLLELQLTLQREQQRLRLITQELEATLDALPHVVCLLDAQRCILRANRVAQVWGLELPKRQDRLSLHAFLHPRCMDSNCFLASRIVQAWRQLAQGEFAQFEVEDDQLERHLHFLFRRILSTPSILEDSPASYAVAVIQDLTELKRAEIIHSEVLRLRNELQKQASFENIVGRSPQMRQVFELIRQTLHNDITVLIQGESGTGKELVARAIHFNSARKRGPFVTVNCAALPETLIESELFGHERGAFTGATARRIGKFEQAQGGTLFLDEIGEMALPLQSKLLRAIQEREIQRLGGTGNIPVDVRIIAATHKDLEVAVRRGTFSEGLYYRIAAFPIRLPPLRERKEDIPVLAEHFLQMQSQTMGRVLGGITPEAMEILTRYRWPGNVRELENLIQRAILLERTDRLQGNNPALREIQETTLHEPDPDAILPLKEVEKRAILRALQATQQNVSQAAELLGVNRATIYRKLKKYGLEM